MKILFITAFPPCQKTAGQDYSRRLILDLVAKGHDISLIYAEYPKHIVELPESVEILRTITPSIKYCIQKPFFHPFFTKRFEKNTLCFIQSIAANYDMLYFDFSQVHIYSLFVQHQNKVFMCHDVIAQKFGRKGRLQLPFIKHTEKKLLKKANKIITFSKKDCDFIKKTYNLNSLNVNFYLKNEHFTYKDSKIETNLFCFYGAWNREENKEALEWFLRNVNTKLSSNFNFVIIGGGMPELLQQKITNYQNISYLGFVEDPVKEISKCQALIAPLHKGAGVKVKVIDALSSGTCVIGTDVAFEGIEDNVQNSLFYHACSPESFGETLRKWQTVDVKQKQSAADEFFERYNTNHFTDLI